MGGGFGQPCTATTERSVSYTAGECGNTDAVCPSPPMPSSRTSKVGTGPWSSGARLAREQRGVLLGGGLGPGRPGALVGAHRVHLRRVHPDVVEQRGARLRVVALGVAGRQEPLVAPVELDLAPVDGVARHRGPHLLQHRDPDAAAGEHQLRHAARGLDVHQPGDQPGRGGGRQDVRLRVDGDLRCAHAASSLALVGRVAALLLDGELAAPTHPAGSASSGCRPPDPHVAAPFIVGLIGVRPRLIFAMPASAAP